MSTEVREIERSGPEIERFQDIRALETEFRLLISKQLVLLNNAEKIGVTFETQLARDGGGVWSLASFSRREDLMK